MIDTKDLRSPSYWMCGSKDGHEGESYLPVLAADEIDALRVRLEAAEKERDEFKRACFGHISDNSMLRAKITEMEQQEPVAYMPSTTKLMLERGGSGVVWNCHSRCVADEPLYPAPGAKGE